MLDSQYRRALGKVMLLRALEIGIDPVGLPAELSALVGWWEAKSSEERQQLIQSEKQKAEAFSKIRST